MKFDREELLSVLSDVSPALARTSLMEGYKNLWFDKKYVYAYDGGLGVRKALKTDLDCGVPGKALLDLLRTSALKEVFLDQVGEQVVLQMGKSKVSLVSLPSDIFFGEGKTPGLWAFPLGKPKNGVALNMSEEFVLALGKLLFVRKSKPDLPHQHGITVTPQKKDIELYSTDSRSLAQAIVAEKPPAGLERFIMPWGFVDRVLALVEPEADILVNDCLMVESEDVRVFSNLLENQETPDLAKFANRYWDQVGDAAPLPTMLPPVLERAAILAGNAEDAVVSFSITGGMLKLSGRYTLGAVEEQLTLKKQLPDAAAKFTAELLTRGLGQVSSFTLTKDVMILLDEDETFMYVVTAKGK